MAYDPEHGWTHSAAVPEGENTRILIFDENDNIIRSVLSKPLVRCPERGVAILKIRDRLDKKYGIIREEESLA